MKNSNDTMGNRTRDLLTCSAVPQPSAPPPGSPIDGYRRLFPAVVRQLERGLDHARPSSAEAENG